MAGYESWRFLNFEIRWTIFPILYFPAIFSGILIFLREKPNVSKWWKRLTIALVVISILWAGLAILSVELFSGISETETSIDRYESILSNWHNKSLVAHFPSSIPPYASHPQLSYFPGYMQGGSHFQVRFGIPSDTWSVIHDAMSERSIRRFTGGNTNDHINMDSGLPTTFDYFGDSEIRSFPNDFEILVLIAVPYETSPVSWNHGRASGVALSKLRSEVVYWAESW